MKKRLRLMLPVVLMVALCVVLLAACTTKEGKRTKYTVTYVSGDANATGAAPKAAPRSAGEKFEIKANKFVLAGKEFAGWSDGTTVYQPSAEYTMPAGNVTFTAQWQDAPKYTLTFAKGGARGKTADGTEIEVKSYEGGKKVTLPTPDWTNGSMVFGCWTDGTRTYAAGAEFTMPGENTTLTAKWVQGYKAEYAIAAEDVFPAGEPEAQEADYVQGNLPAAKYFKAGTEITIEDGMGLTYAEHDFGGWKLSASPDTVYEAGDTYTMTESDVTFFATWLVKKYTVTLKSGIDGVDDIVLDTTYAKGESVFLINFADRMTVPSKHRVGWSLTRGGAPIEEDSDYDCLEMPSGGLTLWALWVDALNVTYEKNDADATGDAPVDSHTYIGSDRTATLAENTFTNENKIFVGWKIKGDDDSALYLPGNDYTIPEGRDTDVVFVAIWADLIKSGIWTSDDATKPLTVDVGIEFDGTQYLNNNTVAEYKINIDYEGKHVLLAYDDATEVWTGAADTAEYALSIADDTLTLEIKTSAAETSVEFDTFEAASGLPENLIGTWDWAGGNKLTLSRDGNKLIFKYGNSAAVELTAYKPDRYMYAYCGTYKKSVKTGFAESVEVDADVILIYTKLTDKHDGAVKYGMLLIEKYICGTHDRNENTESFDCAVTLTCEIIIDGCTPPPSTPQTVENHFPAKHKKRNVRDVRFFSQV